MVSTLLSTLLNSTLHLDMPLLLIFLTWTVSISLFPVLIPVIIHHHAILTIIIDTSGLESIVKNILCKM